jgi:uncharacterized protein (DUF433 family)
MAMVAGLCFAGRMCTLWCAAGLKSRLPGMGRRRYPKRGRCLAIAAAVVEPEPVPLTRDSAGRLMVIGTRVPLDTLVAAFERGDSPESIQESYPTVSLGDIYAIFTYCLRHRAAVNGYLAERAGRRGQLRVEVETRFPPEGLRARLLTQLDA